MKLLAELAFPGWRLRNHLNERMHFMERRDANIPPAPMTVIYEDETAKVSEPHPRRVVTVIRYGPKELDDDGLHASIKPVLDRIKCKSAHGIFAEGYIFDDKPKFCRSEPIQALSPDYDVRVFVFEE